VAATQQEGKAGSSNKVGAPVTGSVKESELEKDQMAISQLQKDKNSLEVNLEKKRAESTKLRGEAKSIETKST